MSAVNLDSLSTLWSSIKSWVLGRFSGQTVLYSGSTPVSTCALSDNPWNYDEIIIELDLESGLYVRVVKVKLEADTYPIFRTFVGTTGCWEVHIRIVFSSNSATINNTKSIRFSYTTTASNGSVGQTANLDSYKNSIKKIIGIKHSIS
jgi:hypothetical protein